MNYCTYNEQGVITRCGFTQCREVLEEIEPRIVFHAQHGVLDTTHYVDLVSLEVVPFTPQEQQAKDTLQPGWRWKMPERVTEYVWSTEQAQVAAVEQVQVQRRAAYPPLADLADALYWQSKGDNSKMEAYLLACDQVKQEIPKVS